MDGNNRWSKKNNLNLYNGYRKGANTLLKLTEFIFNNTEAQYISAFALSKNNLKRSKKLISTLKKVLYEILSNIDDEIHNFNIKFIGNKDFLSQKIKYKIEEIEKIKKKNNKFLLIYINYSGKDDIKNSAKEFYLSKNIKHKSKFEDFLLTKHIPDPDILIRTGGFCRLSDFLIYQFSYTEFFFTKKLWPDLKKIDLINIFNKYYLIERKFGL